MDLEILGIYVGISYKKPIFKFQDTTLNNSCSHLPSSEIIRISYNIILILFVTCVGGKCTYTVYLGYVH